MKKTRKHYTAEEKVALEREHTSLLKQLTRTARSQLTAEQFQYGLEDSSRTAQAQDQLEPSVVMTAS